jgi:hypothetical protein
MKEEGRKGLRDGYSLRRGREAFSLAPFPLNGLVAWSLAPLPLLLRLLRTLSTCHSLLPFRQRYRRRLIASSPPRLNVPSSFFALVRKFTHPFLPESFNLSRLPLRHSFPSTTPHSLKDESMLAPVTMLRTDCKVEWPQLMIKTASS